MMTLYGLLWMAGGNDILAVVFHLNLNHITYFMRVAVFIIPVIAFIITKRWCISLQRSDNEKLLHGYETGIIMRSAEGAYTERHLPISAASAYTLTARDRDLVVDPVASVDGNGVAARGTRAAAIRARLSSAMFADNVQKPTVEDLEEGHHDAEHELELETGLDHSADGHQFDGRHPVEGETLRH